MLHLFGSLPWNPKHTLFEFYVSVVVLLQRQYISKQYSQTLNSMAF